MKKSIILSHSGKQHSYHVANALDDLGYLDTFFTSSYVNSKKLQDWALHNDNKFISRRFLEGLYGAKVKSHWKYEIKELLLLKLYGKSSKVLSAVYERDQKFDINIAKKVIKASAEIYWGFQGSSLESLKAAKASGKIAICELATAHAPEALRILGEEADLQPEWATSIDNLHFPPDYLKRLENEPKIADIVIAASTFTEKSLINSGIDRSKIKVLPLGFDLKRIPYVQKTFNSAEKKLKLLYAGTVTQRKGIKYLLEAMKQLNDSAIELDVIGHVHGIIEKPLKEYNKWFKLYPAVSQPEIFKKYSEYDALVLPSVFEGFGLVIVEAMAAGIPIITTNHTIGGDIIDDGREGYIVPIRDINSISNAILKLKNLNHEERAEMRLNARKKALDYSWDKYKERLACFLDELN